VGVHGKKDAAGLVSKYKARLAAKGYVQRQGVDFDEVFAPMARLESLRLLLAHATNEGWAVHHMDVKSAFLNGELQEEVYVEQPPALSSRGKMARCCASSRRCTGFAKPPAPGTRSWTARCWDLASGVATPSTLFISAVKAHVASSWGCMSMTL